MTAPDLSTTSDQDLVARFLDGDEAAFAELDRRYRGTVLKKILGIVRHQERAEDLTQETFRKVANNLDGYSAEREFGPWIATIAKNTARDYVKRLVFRSNSPAARSVARVENRATDGDDSGGTPRPDTVEFAQALAEALGQLKPLYRDCFVMHEYEGKDYDEIARALRIPKGSVGSNLSRARKALRRILRPYLEPPSADPA